MLFFIVKCDKNCCLHNVLREPIGGTREILDLEMRRGERNGETGIERPEPRERKCACVSISKG